MTSWTSSQACRKLVGCHIPSAYLLYAFLRWSALTTFHFLMNTVPLKRNGSTLLESSICSGLISLRSLRSYQEIRAAHPTWKSHQSCIEWTTSHSAHLPMLIKDLRPWCSEVKPLSHFSFCVSNGAFWSSILPFYCYILAFFSGTYRPNTRQLALANTKLCGWGTMHFFILSTSWLRGYFQLFISVMWGKPSVELRVNLTYCL